jgi:hypothetical protein
MPQLPGDTITEPRNPKRTSMNSEGFLMSLLSVVQHDGEHLVWRNWSMGHLPDAADR